MLFAAARVVIFGMRLVASRLVMAQFSQLRVVMARQLSRPVMAVKLELSPQSKFVSAVQPVTFNEVSLLA